MKNRHLERAKDEALSTIDYMVDEILELEAENDELKQRIVDLEEQIYELQHEER